MVLHLVEEEEGPAVPGELALGEPELLEAFAAHRLVALLVEPAHAEEGHVEALGEDLAELGLARTGRAVEEDVHPSRATRERAPDHPLDVIAVAGHVVEVRPLELARGRRVEEQPVHVGSGAGGRGGEPVQPVERLQVPVAVDADESRADERRVRPQPALDGVRRHAKERGQRRTVVTGKLEVRAAAAMLPEEPDDAVAVEADCANAEGKDDDRPDRDPRIEVPATQREMTS